MQTNLTNGVTIQQDPQNTGHLLMRPRIAQLRTHPISNLPLLFFFLPPTPTITYYHNTITKSKTQNVRKILNFAYQTGMSATTWTQIANGFLELEGFALVLGPKDLETWRLKGRLINPLKEERGITVSFWCVAK